MKNDDTGRSRPDWMAEAEAVELPTDPAELDARDAKFNEDLAKAIEEYFSKMDSQSRRGAKVKKVLDDNPPKKNADDTSYVERFRALDRILYNEPMKKADDTGYSMPDWMAEAEKEELPTDPAELDRLIAQTRENIANDLEALTASMRKNMPRPPEIKKVLDDNAPKKNADDTSYSMPDWMGELDNIELPTDPAELDKLMAQNDAEIANLLGQLTGSTTGEQLPPEIKKVLDDNAPKVKRKPVAAKQPVAKAAPGVMSPEKQKEINDVPSKINWLEEEGDNEATLAAIDKIEQLLADLAKMHPPTTPAELLKAEIGRIVSRHIPNIGNKSYEDFFESMEAALSDTSKIPVPIRAEIQIMLIQATWQTYDKSVE
jgi:hypothetical protein